MITAVAVVLLLAVVAYAVFGGADFGAGFWDLTAGGAAARRPPARGHRTLDRTRVGSQPRLVDLHLRRPVDVVPRGLRLDHADAVRSADDRGPGHRAARSQLRLPQGGRHDALPAHLRSGVRHLLGAGPVLHGSDRGRDRVRTSAGRRPGGGSGRQLDQPDLRRGWGPGRRRGRLPVCGLSRVGRPTPGRDGHGRVLPPPSSCLRHRRGRDRCRRRLRAARRCRLPVRRSHLARPAGG